MNMNADNMKLLYENKWSSPADAMKYYGNFILRMTFFFFVLFAGVACNDTYDEHYRFNNEERSELNLLDYLKSRDDLSQFVRLLEFSGYADTLALPQTFTVFALPNEALEGLSLETSNLETLKLLTGNHLVSNAQTSSGIVKAFNGKYILLSGSGGTYSYGGVNAKEANLLAKNGIIYVMETPIAYENNIWELIQTSEVLDSIKTYVNSLTQWVFDPEASYDENHVFLDSVFVKKNRFLDELGPIDNELFPATALLPSDQAWKEVYTRIHPYYRSLDKKEDNVVVKTGAQVQDERTKWAIVQDAVFLGSMADPSAQDSLVSTYGNTFKTPGYLFQQTTQYALSNGYAYLTDHVENKLEDSWLKKIEVEAEANPYQLRSRENCTLTTYTSFGTNFTASANYYTRFEQLPTNDYSRVSARFPIPNTLAKVKYNIYCVFMPISAIDPTDKRPYKLNFYLSYVNENGNQETDIPLSVTNAVTEPDQVTKLLVASQYEFAYCDLLSPTESPDIKVFLKVENAATVREERVGTYSRNIAIDQIILEPVIED